MLVAFACSITFVPAVLAILKPPGESIPVGFRRLAPLDDRGDRRYYRRGASGYAALGMGKLMALALLCTMSAAVLFQSVQMGRPRQIEENSPSAPQLTPKAAE